MENVNSEDVGERMIISNKLRSPNQMSDSNTMDSFQDGGQQNMSSEQTEFPTSMEGTHMNSDLNTFPPSSGDHGMGPDNFNRMNENMHHGQLQNFNAFNRGNYNIGDQHGGMSMPGNMEFGNQSSQFHGQYSQSGIRPPYPSIPKPGMTSPRPGMGPPGMSMMTPPGYNPGQRMLSGQTISQQSGPTPTLNQLLQTPNSAQRYQNNYEFTSGQNKGGEMGGGGGGGGGGNVPYNMQQNWHGNQRMGAYPQGPMPPGSSPYRNQNVPLSEMNQQRRQLPPNYPQGGQYGSQQFPPGAQRYPMIPGQGRPGQMSMSSQQSQQQMFMSQQQPPPQQQPQPPGPSPPQQLSTQQQQQLQQSQQQQHKPSSQSQAAQQPSPAPPNTDSSAQQNADSNRNQMKRTGDEDGLRGDLSVGEELNAENSSSRGTPTSSSSHHPSVSGLRHAPSPASSAGSRSNTPASGTAGNQSGSPMPPRPPSSQLDGQGRMSHSPMATQGFNQQMMPPPMGPNQMGYPGGSNKMMGTSMGANQMGHYQQFNSQYPSGNYSRQQNMPGMQNSSGMQNFPQQNMYNGPNQMPGNPMYSNMPMNRGMGNTNFNAYGQGNMGMNNQYGGFNSHINQGPGPGSVSVPPQGPVTGPGPTMGANVPPQSGMNTMNQPGMNNMGMQSSVGIAGGVKGAQAAAQAAMIAAANSAAARSQARQQQGSSPSRMFSPQPGTPVNQMSMNHMGAMTYSNPNLNSLSNSVNQISNSASQCPVPNSMGLSTSSGHLNSSNLPTSTMAGNSMVPGSVSSDMPVVSTGIPSSMGNMDSLMSSKPSSTPSMSQPVEVSLNSAVHNSSSSETNKVTLNSGSSDVPVNSCVPVSKSAEEMCPQSSHPDPRTMNNAFTSPPTPVDNASGPSSQSSDTRTPSVSTAEDVASASSMPESVQQPITTTANTVIGGGITTHVTQSITCPVTSVSESNFNSQGTMHDSIPSVPPVNCVPMPAFPEEPPEKKKKKTGSSDLSKLFDMGQEPDRRPFLEKLLSFLDEKGTPVTTMPAISKQPLDLYKLYYQVRERGGMVEVNKAKKWKEICGIVNIGSSASAAFTLKKNYIKYLFAYECKFDRGGIDPQPILAQMEAQLQQKREQKQKRAPSPAGSQGSSQDAFRPPSTPNSQMMDPFSPGMPPPYMQNSEQGMVPMGGNMMPPNNMMNSMNPSAMMPPVGGNSGNMSHPSMMGSGHGSMQSNMMGSGMSHNNMMASNMPPNSMMGGNVPQNNMMSGTVPSSGMMGNNNMMPGSIPPNSSNIMGTGNSYSGPQNGMMGNNMMPPNSMMGSSMGPPSGKPLPTSAPNAMPTTSESISVQDPFADEPNSSGQFSRPNMNSQMPPYSSMQQPQQPGHNAPGSFSYPGRPGPGPASGPGPGPNMTGYAGMNQSSISNMDGMNCIPSQGDQFNEPYRRQMGNTDNFPPNSTRSIDSFPPGPNQYGNRPPQSSSNQFPFGQQFDRPERFEQASSQHGQQFRPSSQSGMIPQSSNEAMYTARYSNPQMPMRPPNPQEQFPNTQSFPVQAPGYGGPRPGVKQEPYPNYNNQQGSFPGPRPPMTRDMPGTMYGTPNKRYPDMDRVPPDHRRDSSQWSSVPQRFSSQQGGPNFINTAMSGMPPGAPGTPPMGSFARTMGHRSSPQTRDKNFMPPTKGQQKPGTMIPNAQFPPKKEIVFPPDSVEAVQPLLAKRRRLNHKDIGTLEAWRLMMGLKSGLLAESSWALDTLNILLYDDSTIAYFNLAHLPGLLEVLLEHFRRCLIEIFGIFEELEIGYEKKCRLQSGQGSGDISSKSVDQSQASKCEMPNYTLITRNGKTVKIEDHSEENWVEDDKKWDFFCGFNGGSEHWQLGRGDITSHIVTHFTGNNASDLYKNLFFKKRTKEDIGVSDEIKDGKEEDSVNNNNINHVSNAKSETEEQAVMSEEDTISMKVEKEDHLETCDKVKMRNHCIKRVQIKTEPRDPEMDCSDTSDAPTAEEESEVKKMDATEECMEKNCGSDEGCLQLPKCDSDEKTSNNSSQGTLLGKSFAPDEEEAYQWDEPPLCLASEGLEELGQRCVCISNIIRSLSCIPGNDAEMSKHPGLVRILGKLLLLHHRHLPRLKCHRKFEKDESDNDEVIETNGEEGEWWWGFLNALRENTLVIFANICGHLDLSKFPEEICFPVLDGLLHWVVCPSSCARDPLPSMASTSNLSPQRLVLEALCKLCIHDANVDLLLATPPFERIVELFVNLCKLLANRKEQVTQEFSIVLLSELVQGDSCAARAIALQHPCISLLVDFLETAEQNALQIANSQGINVLQNNPEMMGTSLDMLRRAATILLHLAHVPDNRTLFTRHQSRLLSLVMSQILDQTVAQILSEVLFECSQT